MDSGAGAFGDGRDKPTAATRRSARGHASAPDEPKATDYPPLSGDLAGILNSAVEAARIGGEIDHRAFGHLKPHQADRKNDAVWDPVTSVDRDAERAITSFLAERYPNHAFLGEENIAGRDQEAEHLWVIDPIDGTANFVHGVPHYAVAVGYAYRGRVMASACLDPERDELFTAVRGGGAFLNGKPIEVAPDRRATTVADALICTGFHYDRGAIMERTLASIHSLFQNGIHGLRRSGSAVLDISWTAAGRYDAFFEYILGPWDFGAASLIAEECGLRISAADGSPLSFSSRSVACSAPAIYDELMGIIGTPV